MPLPDSLAQIDVDVLLRFGARSKQFKRNEVIFLEDAPAKYYFQIERGEVKMYNSNNEGKEFIQGIFGAGQSFGEPPLFLNAPYPASAVASTDAVVLALPVEKFLILLQENPLIQFTLLQTLSERLYYKAVTARSIIYNTPEKRILAFLNVYKSKSGFQSGRIHVTHTRQEIANFTGLRVETVIRTLQDMKRQNLVEINNRKLYF